LRRALAAIAFALAPLALAQDAATRLLAQWTLAGEGRDFGSLEQLL